MVVEIRTADADERFVYEGSKQCPGFGYVLLRRERKNVNVQIVMGSVGNRKPIRLTPNH